jgi:hypothetical protein
MRNGLFCFWPNCAVTVIRPPRKLSGDKLPSIDFGVSETAHPRLRGGPRVVRFAADNSCLAGNFVKKMNSLRSLTAGSVGGKVGAVILTICLLQGGAKF